MRIPRLATLWPWMMMVALIGHVAVAVVLFSTEPEPSSGGGGKVLGKLSVALGSGAPKSKMKNTETPSEPVAQDARKPPKVLAKRVPASPSKPAPEPVLEMPPDSATASHARNATPTLGSGAAASSPGNSGGTEKSTSVHDAYLAMLRARIEAKRTYPATARRAGQQGVASLRLTITADGTLTQLHVIQSSGHFALDRTAKRMVQKSAPFPAPPRTRFEVTIPIVFELR
ncbi:energy transducer TonB [Pyruvatibacter sp.]|uniref:energy transducer TonB n=1 Tax=Pyruvatibacter sp. TaxID=1981328 RepID=UPI0032EDA64D